MTKDEVLKLAKECGAISTAYKADLHWKEDGGAVFNADQLLAFANAIADAQRERICAEFSPRQWTKEMSEAWHLNIPDVQAAFDALIDATKVNKE